MRRVNFGVSCLMKLIIACWIACLCLVGCTPSENFMDSLFGIKHNVVVLASSALNISPAEVSFTPSKAEVVGNESRVCIVLAGGVPGEGSDKEVERILNGAKLSATVTMDDGVNYEFRCQGSGWALSGRIVPANEVTACVLPSCKEKAMPLGSKVRSAAISSTLPIQALGVYWDSTGAFDQNGN